MSFTMGQEAWSGTAGARCDCCPKHQHKQRRVKIYSLPIPTPGKILYAVLGDDGWPNFVEESALHQKPTKTPTKKRTSV